ncbi:MAG: response regulator [Deltaproteobacteria bacterium]|nr:response regulator [Deltaproteobacteria bacterium]
MLSALVFSSNQVASALLEKTARKEGINCQIASTADEALEALSTETFNIALIDYASANIAESLKLFTAGWAFNPLMVACIFSQTEEIPQKWDAVLAGVKVFSGKEAFTEIQQALRELANHTPTVGDFGILLVEDLDSPRDIISAYIESMGFPHLTGVSGATDALRVLENSPGSYYCIITDINMPGISGIELMKAVRSDDRFRHLPIIVLTAYGTPANLINCIKAGATGFLVKPFKKKAMREELEKAKRIFTNRQSPRLCSPDEAHMLEEALHRKGLL